MPDPTPKSFNVETRLRPGGTWDLWTPDPVTRERAEQIVKLLKNFYSAADEQARIVELVLDYQI